MPLCTPFDVDVIRDLPTLLALDAGQIDDGGVPSSSLQASQPRSHSVVSLTSSRADPSLAAGVLTTSGHHVLL